MIGLIADRHDNKPQITIGIIGSQRTVDKVLEVVKSFPTFKPLVQVIDQDEETFIISDQLKDHAEVLLLSSQATQRRIKEHAALTIPVHVVPLTGAALYRAIFIALQKGKLHHTISIDTLTKGMVMRTLKELGVNQFNVVVYDGPAYSPAEDVIAFHHDQAKTDAHTVAFTGAESVARTLVSLNVSNEWLEPTEQDIIVTLERALLSTESRREKEAQIVVGVINVDNFSKLALIRNNEHEVQKLKLDIHGMVLDYVESLDGYLISHGGDEFLFFTTRGIFERETSGYKMIPLAKEAHKTHGVSLSFGVGFGASANEAGTNARTALHKSKEGGGNTCFIVREDKTLIGPLEMADPLLNIVSPTDHALIKRAEDAGMTSAYLSKLLNNLSRFGKTDYSVHELALLLNISVRSTHRLLLSWIDHNLAEVSRLEKVPKGRPRQIFRFTFLYNAQ